MKKYIFIINYFYIFNNFSIFCNTNNDESTEILYDDLYFNNNKNIKENIFNYDPFEISQMDSNGEIPIKKK